MIHVGSARGTCRPSAVEIKRCNEAQESEGESHHTSVTWLTLGVHTAFLKI